MWIHNVCMQTSDHHRYGLILCVSEGFLCQWMWIHNVCMGNFCLHVEIFFCFWRLPFRVNVDPQCVQANFWSSWIDLKAYLMSKCGSTMFAWKYLAFLPSCSDFLCLLKTPNYNAICKTARTGATHLWSPVFSQFHYFTIWCNSVIHPDTPPSPPWPNPTQPNPTCLLTQTCFSIYLKYDSD